MRVRRFQLLAVAALAAFASPVALADESVTFTNGASMVVVSHQFDAKTGMIRLDLGAGSSIKFPANMIESITVAGKSVFSGSNVVVPNQTVAVDRASGVPAYTVGSNDERGASLDYNAPSRVRSASERRRGLLDPEAQLMAAQAPPDLNPGTPVGGAVGQKLRMMARPRERSLEDPAGTTPASNGNFTLGSSAATAPRVFPEIGPRGRSAPPPATPPPPPADSEQPPPPPEDEEPPTDDPGSNR